MRFILRSFIAVFLNALVLMIVAQIFDAFYLDSFGTALLASVILSILNIIVKPFLIILTLPITIMTLGLFLFVVNAITLMVAQGVMGPSFVIEGFGTAIIASIIISIINTFLTRVKKNAVRY